MKAGVELGERAEYVGIDMSEEGWAVCCVARFVICEYAYDYDISYLMR